MKNNKGFTLIELMMVIAITGILAAIGTPRFFAYKNDTKVRAATNQIVGTLQMAKSRAVKDNDSVTVTFNSSSYTLTSTNLNKQYTLSGITITNTLAGNDTVFSSKGWLDDSGSVTVQNSSRNMQINLTRLGRISIN